MAKDVFHSFVIGINLFPLLGGWISDRWTGKYQTVFWLSLLTCVGHGFLACFEREALLTRIAATGLGQNAFLMSYFAGLALLVALAFALYARGYPMQDRYRRTAP